MDNINDKTNHESKKNNKNNKDNIEKRKKHKPKYNTDVKIYYGKFTVYFD